MKLTIEKMKTITKVNICWIQILLLLPTLMGCKSSGEFDPGPFAPGEKEAKTSLTFNVSDASGNPIEGAYVVSFRKLAPLHIRVGEGFTDAQGLIQIEDNTDTKEGYANIVAPGYNSHKVALKVDQKKENRISVTLTKQNVLKILSYNVEEGFKDDAALRKKFAEWVAQYDPDVILLQEMQHFTDQSFGEFAKSYGHEYAVLSKTVGFPTGITSKEEIKDIRKVIKTGVLHHGYVSGETFGIRLFSVHLNPYELDNDRNIHKIARKDEIKIILDDAQSYAGQPVIIGGDLNDHNEFDRDTFGPGYRYGERDHTVTNTCKAYGYFDSYPLLNTEFKSTSVEKNNTTNEGYRIDYIFVNQLLKSNVVYADIVQSAYTDQFSDHYPMYIEIKKSN
ncbi:MAG: endonuclease/exonuclease/phosphatase family protein [Sphingobacterium sp.]|uniref:endonuclease/exonuclease/phosphatase family protein n=1 Tax=Sphingobacterium sp. JB170 TaxID=1434842 RepID=UPI000B358D1A|nr:endonuclease/exonuclease/phosphatase family protein [Sphingobacterium sp. JB170]